MDGLDNGAPVAPDLLAGPAALDVGTMLVGAGDSSADTIEQSAAAVDRATAAAIAAQASQRQRRHSQLRIASCRLMFGAPSVALCRAVLRKSRRRVLWKKRGASQLACFC